MTEADEKRRPVLALDFDGVVHDYREGWRGGEIYGSVLPGFWEWLASAREKFFVVIHSSRFSDLAQVDRVSAWLRRELKRWCDESLTERVTIADELWPTHLSATKPPAVVTIDDRCVRFGGDWSAPELQPEALLAYRTWSQGPSEFPPQGLSVPDVGLEPRLFDELSGQCEALLATGVKTLVQVSDDCIRVVVSAPGEGGSRTLSMREVGYAELSASGAPLALAGALRLAVRGLTEPFATVDEHSYPTPTRDGWYWGRGPSDSPGGGMGPWEVVRVFRGAAWFNGEESYCRDLSTLDWGPEVVKPEALV